MTYVPLTADYQVPFRSQITIRQLMRHRAGVFDVTNTAIPDTVSIGIPYKGQKYMEFVMNTDPGHTFTFDELVGVAATCRLFYFQPGESYHYSNTGYSILGKIIERVSGQDYSRFIMEHIVQPMGLTNTSFPSLGNDQQVPAPFVSGTYFDSDTIGDCTESNMSGNVAEGNIITTPDDLSAFLRNLIRGNGILHSYWINKIMLVPLAGSGEGDGYGCGIENIFNLGFGHSGAHAGYLSRMATDPQTDFTVVAFTNAWDYSNGLTSMKEQLYNLVDEACYRAKGIVP
jgi:D-alanyl-D-alanine carboxypeptidase